jgi:hypothetical protein
MQITVSKCHFLLFIGLSITFLIFTKVEINHLKKICNKIPQIEKLAKLGDN